MSDATSETVDLLQRMIRNACVNDGRIDSGGESRNAELLLSELEPTSATIERYESVPGRANIVARLEGSDPSAPSLALMGHMDVVPVNADRWRRDPFGGELVDGEVWGRGAVDMLNVTASQAVVFKRLASSGFKPRGDLLYIGVADEETGGEAGARWLVENEPDAVRCDYMLTEFGGMRVPTAPPDAPAFPVAVAEKGANWVKVRFRGTPGHASAPHRSDNALVKAAKAVQRLAEHHPPARIDDVWSRFVAGLGLPEEIAAALSDPATVEQVIAALPDAGLARMVQACTHTTFAPTVLHAGVKTNVIPDTAEIEVDVRTMHGDGPDETVAMLREILGEELAGDADIEVVVPGVATRSPPDTPLWDALREATRAMVPGAQPIPMLMTGATDSRFFRRLGTVCYGYALFSDRLSFAEFSAMFHGDDERVDVESLRLTTELWEHVVRRMLG